MYKLGISNIALKKLKAIDDTEYLRISNKINRLAETPRPNGAIKLTDLEGYRIRAGNYRILYTIDDKKMEIVIYSIDHRKDVYRKR